MSKRYIVKNISRSTEQQLRWRKYARQCIKPALDYYKEHLQADIMSTPLKAFKAARLFDSHYLNKVKPQNVALNSLLVLPFVTEPSSKKSTHNTLQLQRIFQQTVKLSHFGICMPTAFLYGRKMLLRYYYFSHLLLLLNVCSLFSRTPLGISS